MKFTMTKIAAGLMLSAAAFSAQAAVSSGAFTFVNGLGSASFTSGQFGNTGAAASGFGAGNEFRMISPANAVGGGGQKSTINGGEVWSFDATQMTGVAGTGVVGGAASSTHCTAGGCPGLDQGASFFGPIFGFLAPYAGNTSGLTPASVAWGGLSDGVASIGDTFSIAMPLAEAHWGGSRFPMANVTFNGKIVGAGGAFNMTAEHLITVAEDPDAAGFSGWTAQWNYDGNVALTTAAPVPEASTYGMMLAGLGLVGFAVRRRKLVA